MTTFAAKSIVGEKDNWTYGNFNSIIGQDDFFEAIFDPTYTRDALLETLLFASGNKLIDWSKGERYFTSDYFIDVLEVLKSVPSVIPEDAVVAGNMASMIKNSHSLLFHCVADSPWRVSSTVSPEVFVEDYCFPGFPEIGNVIVPKIIFGISSSSPSKDKCWEFLREFILEKNSDSHRMSPRSEAIEQLAKNEWQQAVNGGYSQNHPYVQSAMQDFIEAMKDSNTIYRYDSNVLDIVKSETGAYFAGDKSAEQVRKIFSQESQFTSPSKVNAGSAIHTIVPKEKTWYKVHMTTGTYAGKEGHLRSAVASKELLPKKKNCNRYSCTCICCLRISILCFCRQWNNSL